MIQRDIEQELALATREYPVITITGPRQSGKTTLARYFFKQLPYVNFEDPLQRDYFLTDPIQFLTNYREGAIFDEVQHLPELMSHLQVLVDENPATGKYILTGSQHFGLLSRITQSLAGRTALLELLPFSLNELKRGGYVNDQIDMMMYRGAYPPVYVRSIRPERWYGDYIATYLQRDLRQISQIQYLDTFTRFLRILAGQVGQLLNTNRLGNELGVDHKTVVKWISILQASYLIRLLEPYHRNFRKRVIKTPKIYFYDTGLVCHLLGIRNVAQLEIHPLRGEIFENWVFAELVKRFFNQGQTPPIYFWRTHGGQEIDFIIEKGNRVLAVETKSGMTVHPQIVQKMQRTLRVWSENGVSVASWIVYAGKEEFQVLDTRIMPWQEIDKIPLN